MSYRRSLPARSGHNALRAVVAGGWIGLYLAGCPGPEQYERRGNGGGGQAGGGAPMGAGGSSVNGAGGSSVNGAGGTVVSGTGGSSAGGAGGTAGRAGAPGTGGMAAAGGTTGTAGATGGAGRGGTTGAGGVAGRGGMTGAAGRAGAPGTGGTAAAAGTAGTAGATGGAGRGGTTGTGGVAGRGGMTGSAGTTGNAGRGGAAAAGGAAGCADADGDGMTDCDEANDGSAWTDPTIFNGFRVEHGNQCSAGGSCAENDMLQEVTACMQGNVVEEKNQYGGWDWENPPDDICDAGYGFAPRWNSCDFSWAARWSGCIHFETGGPHCFQIVGGTAEGCAALYFNGNSGSADVQSGTPVKCFNVAAADYPILLHYTMDNGSSSSMHVRYCDALGDATCTPSTAVPSRMLRTSCP
jgi:hypothetical protein